ncbi:YbgA family protein [Kaarinaea lacus]
MKSKQNILIPIPGTNKSNRIVVGVSSCLLGQQVRFDGNHKHNKTVTDQLSKHWEYVPICPEMAIGMGVPRRPIRLHGDESTPRAIGVSDKSIDVTHALIEFGQRKAKELSNISGYIFKKGSPSCGMERIKVYHGENNLLSTNGVGLYAKQIMDANPLLPVEEEGRLADQGLRENFIQRVYVYHTWQQLTQAGLTAQQLIQFHTQIKFTLLAHCEQTYRQLGRLIADLTKDSLNEIANEYIAQLMQGLKKPATRTRHCNVLMHIMGFLKRHLNSADKQELIEAIEHYKVGAVSIDVPKVLLRHHLRYAPSRYIEQQLYFQLAV